MTSIENKNSTVLRTLVEIGQIAINMIGALHLSIKSHIGTKFSATRSLSGDLVVGEGR